MTPPHPLPPKTGQNCKTTKPMTDMDFTSKAGRTPGGQVANRNALKTGLHTAEMRALRARFAQLRKAFRTIQSRAEAEIMVARQMRKLRPSIIAQNCFDLQAATRSPSPRSAKQETPHGNAQTRNL